MIRRPLSLFILLGSISTIACSRTGDPPAGAAETSPQSGTAAPNAATAGAPGSMQEPATPDTVRSGTAPQATAPVDPAKFPDVVAKVDGRPILKVDLVNAAQQLAAQKAMKEGRPPAPTLEFFKDVLDSLVVRELLYGDAKAQGLLASEAEVKRRVDDLKKRYPDPKKFAEALKAQGFTEQTLAENARVTLTVDKLVAEKYAPAVQVTESSVRAFYDAHPDQMRVPERRRLRHILIRPEGDTPAAKEKAKKLAEEVLARLKKGEDFATLAKQYSADPGSKEKGGELPPLTKGETVPQFEQAAWALKKDEISGVVETQFGHHIIQVLEILPVSQVPFDQVRPRLEQFLRQRDLQKGVRARADQLRAKAKVEILI